MSDQPVPGGPRAIGDAPAADNMVVGARWRSGLLWPVVLAVVVVAVLGGVAVALAVTRPAWGVFLCVGLGVAAALTALGAAVRIRSAARFLVGPEQPVRPATVEAPIVLFEDNPGRRRDVFGKLARRLQGLVNLAIRAIDGQERQIEDPDQLRGLFEIDHLMTRVRRQAENLAVLGGEALQRRSKAPVDVYAVMRAAVGEIEHYRQVTIMPIEQAKVHGHVVAEVIHLLAELLDNATIFTAPDAPRVVLRAYRVTAGLAIEVQDRGLGMPLEEQQRVNRLLDGSDNIDLGELLQDGRIGLGVVRELARRHGIRVQLRTNIFGGTDAAVVLPPHLLGDDQADLVAPQRQVRAGTAATTVRVGPEQPGDTGTTLSVQAGVSSGHHRPDQETVMVRADQPASPAAPSLPVRAPGASFPPPGAVRAAEAARQLPPLPQRRDTASHLREELRRSPIEATVVPGHNPNLVAAARRGLERSELPAESPSTQIVSRQGDHTA